MDVDAEMADRWTRLETWLTDNAPAMSETLGPPATADDLDRAESDLGLALPPSVRRSYRIHDGAGSDPHGLFGYWRLLPLSKVTRWADDMARIVEADFDRDYWDPDVAVPIMANVAGDLAYVEHAPDGGETPVVEWDHERASHEELAPSFPAFFDSFLTAVEAGEYDYDPDGPKLVHEDGPDETPGY